MERGYTPGVVFGVVDRRGAAFGAVGHAGPGEAAALDADTVFPLGSITKTFTGLLLADAVERGEVTLATPVGQVLSGTSPEAGVLTLESLATHTSGLPRLPDDWAPRNPLDPYADYTEELLREYLGRARPGEARYEYSNLGAGLLGYLLARRAKLPYEDLVVDRIGRPLGMATLALAGPGRSATQGTDVDGTPVPPWTWGVLAGCGGLQCSARDLARLVEAQLGLRATPLQEAIRATHLPRGATAMPGWSAGLGWMVDPTGRVAWHDGGTYGSYALVALDREEGRGWFWLSNAGLWQVPGIQRRLLQIARGEPQAPFLLPRIVLQASEDLLPLTGHYRGPEGPLFVVTLAEGNLVLGFQGAETTVLRASERDHFFVLEDEDLRLTFHRGPDGRGTSLVLQAGERSLTTQRLR